MVTRICMAAAMVTAMLVTVCVGQSPETVPKAFLGVWTPDYEKMADLHYDRLPEAARSKITRQKWIAFNRKSGFPFRCLVLTATNMAFSADSNFATAYVHGKDGKGKKLDVEAVDALQGKPSTQVGPYQVLQRGSNTVTVVCDGKQLVLESKSADRMWMSSGGSPDETLPLKRVPQKEPPNAKPGQD